MTTTRRRNRMRRTQISFPQEQYESAIRIAARRGVSLAEFVRESVKDAEERDEQEHREYIKRMKRIVGIVEGYPDASTTIDEVLYEHRDEP